MAEAVAVVALVASITSLVDVCTKVVSRVKESPACSHPDIEAYPNSGQSGHVTAAEADELDALVSSVLGQVRLIEQCLQGLIPSASASRLDRTLVAFKSLAKDEKVNQAIEKIHHGIDVLVLHLSSSAVEVGDQVLLELRQLSVQSSRPQQPIAQQAFGLCFGQAPLIDADAFVGRRAEIQQLHEWLSPSQNTHNQRVVSIVGMGGRLGKTQLSLAYAREHGQQYSSVFWLDAKDKTRFRQSMSVLTSIIFSDGTPTAATADEESIQLEKVRGWLSEASNNQWLLIFDNYDDPSLPNITSKTGFDLREFFPMRAHGRILITTRSSKLAFSKPLKLQGIQDLDLCIDILAQRSGRNMAEDHNSWRLAVRLDGLPLALAVAGTYIAQSSVSCKEYLDLYDTAWNDLHGPDSEELMEYESRTLSSTWMVSLNLVRDQDADAAELLQLFGYLNNDDIWYELVKAGADSGPPWLNRVTASRIRFDRAMSKLENYRLIEAHSGSFRVHPCLHDWVSEHLNSPLSAPLFTSVIISLSMNILSSDHAQYWITSRRIVNHLDRLRHQKFAHLWNNKITNEDVVRAYQRFGSPYDNLSEHIGAGEMYIRAIAGQEELLGPDHVMTLSTIISLSGVYREQTKLEEAESMYLQVLAREEKVLASDYTLIFSTMNGLGTVYREQNKLEEAENILGRALLGREKVLGPDHLLALESLNSLGNNYRARNKLEEAESMYLRVIAGKERALGPNHPSTLRTISNLGIVYSKQGKLVEAEHIFQQVLAEREKVLGHNNPSIFHTINGLGRIYCEQGKLVEAEHMLRRAESGYEKASLSTSIPACRVFFNLVYLYWGQSRLEEAQTWLQRGASLLEELLGRQHSLTVGALKALEKLNDLIANRGK